MNEIGSLWVDSLFQPTTNNSFFTSLISVVEVLSALNRRKREAGLTTNDYNQISAAFLGTAIDYRFIKLEQPILTASQRLLEVYPLRAGDAVQLASAVVIRASLLNSKLPEPIFLGSDDTLLDAALGEGFTTDNPLLHP